MKVKLELERLKEIREVIGSDAPEIVAGMLASMDEATAQVERSMAQGDQPRRRQRVWPANHRP
jgi:hypothetical protein